MEARYYPGKTQPTPARALLLGAFFALGVAACGGPAVAVRKPPAARVPLPAKWVSLPPDDPASANEVLMRALSLVGTPYRYGGNTPDTGFDCSGLIGYVFRDVLSRTLPRTSGELARAGADIPPRQIATGDLLVFVDAGVVSHVGIYVGEGRFVHAPSTGGTVRLDRLDGPYWREHFSSARRLLRAPLSRS